MNQRVGPEALGGALQRHPWRELPPLAGRTNSKRAGVLLPVLWDPQPLVLATLRPRTMARHAGEVCFAGGMPEPADPDSYATALREAAEELGIVNVDLMGRLSSIPLYTSDHRIDPWVVHLLDPELSIDSREVARVFRISLDDVLARDTVEGVPFTQHGKTRLYPYFELADDAVMYGATAVAFWELLGIYASVAAHPMPRVIRGSRGWRDLLAGARGG